MSVLWRSGRVQVEHAREIWLPGYLFIQSLSADPDLWLHDPDFRAEVSNALSWAERVVRKVLAPEHVYVLRFGESGGAMHFHLIPRTRAVLAAYLLDHADAAPYNGAKIAAWLWESSASLGYSQRDVELFLRAVRRDADA